MALTIASCTAVAPWSPGRWSSITNRLARSTKVPMAEFDAVSLKILWDRLVSIADEINDAQSQLGEGIFFSEIERLERKLQKGDEKLADGKPRILLADDHPVLRSGLDALLSLEDDVVVELVNHRVAGNGPTSASHAARMAALAVSSMACSVP